MNDRVREGRVIRRYRNNIPIEDFPKWQDLIRRRARGCGLYALYAKKRLLYVGLATKSIRTIVETGNESYRFRHSSQIAKARIKSREQSKTKDREDAAEAI